MYKVFSLYCYTGSAKHAPEGFDVTPSLEVYINYLAAQGYEFVQAAHHSDAMWWSLIVKEAK